MPAGADDALMRPHFVRGPQSLISGLVLVALAAFALWLVSDLPQGTLRAMGPAMLPRWLAVGVGLCGVLLIAVSLTAQWSRIFGIVLLVLSALGFIYGGATAVVLALAGLLALATTFGDKDPGAELESFTFRGPLVVVIAILAFACTIRGFALGAVNIPSLGLVVAGPLAIFIAGFATPEARGRDLAILALALTAFCMVLFGDLLNLPIPVYPQWLADLYPATWSSDGRLRATAGILALGAVLIYVATRGRGGNPNVVDVADHSGGGTERGRI